MAELMAGDVIIIKDYPQHYPIKCRCGHTLVYIPSNGPTPTTLHCIPCGRWMHFVKGLWRVANARSAYHHPQTRYLMKYLQKCVVSGMTEEQVHEHYTTAWDLSAERFGVKVLRIMEPYDEEASQPTATTTIRAYDSERQRRGQRRRQGQGDGGE